MSVRRIVALAALTFASTFAAHAQSTPESVTRQWVAAFNAGDMTKAATFNSSTGMSIIDEFAPYTWSGPKGFDGWVAGFDADAKTRTITESIVTLGPVTVNNETATDAYLTFPSVYAYKQKGVAMHESAHISIVLHKESGAWKITAWSWTGTAPKTTK